MFTIRSKVLRHVATQTNPISADTLRNILRGSTTRSAIARATPREDVYLPLFNINIFLALYFWR